MGAEILRPQDWLKKRIIYENCTTSRGRKQPYGIANPSSKFSRRSAPRLESKRREQRRFTDPNPSASLVMGQVKILKRGESLDSRNRSFDSERRKAVTFHDVDLVFTGVERLGPDPESMKIEVKLTGLRPAVPFLSDEYAGSAFSQSPSPSALPLPSFSWKKGRDKAIDDSATNGLRRLLRIG